MSVLIRMALEASKSKILVRDSGSKVGREGALAVDPGAVVLWISVREPRLHSNLKRTPPVPADQRRCASQRLREEALRGRLRVPGSALSTVLVCQRHRGIQVCYSVQNPSHDQKMWSVENTECGNTGYRIQNRIHVRNTPTAFLSGLIITSAECDSERKPQGAAPERMLHALSLIHI